MKNILQYFMLHGIKKQQYLYKVFVSDYFMTTFEFSNSTFSLAEIFPNFYGLVALKVNKKSYE